MPDKTLHITKALLVAGGLVATLAACAQTVWDRPSGRTRADFYADSLNCTRVAEATIGGYAAFGAPIDVAIAKLDNQGAKADVHDTCLRAQGYTPR